MITIRKPGGKRHAHEEPCPSRTHCPKRLPRAAGPVCDRRGEILGVSRQTLNKVVNGQAGISPEMAIRLTKAFGSTEETWLGMQLAYDLAAVRKDESKIKVRLQHIPQELHIT